MSTVPDTADRLHSLEEDRDAVLAAIPSRTRTAYRATSNTLGSVPAEPVPRGRDATGALIPDERGRVRERLSGGAARQGSHVMSALASAGALAVIPEAHDTLPVGAEVGLWWLDRA